MLLTRRSANGVQGSQIAPKLYKNAGRKLLSSTSQTICRCPLSGMLLKTQRPALREGGIDMTELGMKEQLLTTGVGDFVTLRSAIEERLSRHGQRIGGRLENGVQL